MVLEADLAIRRDHQADPVGTRAIGVEIDNDCIRLVGFTNGDVSANGQAMLAVEAVQPEDVVVLMDHPASKCLAILSIDQCDPDTRGIGGREDQPGKAVQREGADTAVGVDQCNRCLFDRSFRCQW